MFVLTKMRGSSNLSSRQTGAKIAPLSVLSGPPPDRGTPDTKHFLDKKKWKGKDLTYPTWVKHLFFRSFG